jgi:hypothetical protein
METLSYFDVGTEEKPVVSNSAMSCLNPEEGGSIVKFINFFKSREEKKDEKPSLTNGKIVHTYIEHPDKFAVEDFKKPTDMMAGLIEKAIALQGDLKNGFSDQIRDVDVTITSKLKKQDAIAAEILQTRAAFEKFANVLKVTTDEAIKLFRAARVQAKAYSSQNELTVLENIVEAHPEAPESKYIQFLLGSRGKLVLDADSYAKVMGAVNSLTFHKATSVLLGLRQDDFAIVDPTEVFKEQPVYWKEIHAFEDQIKVPILCKALLDRLIVNHRTKKITYVDLKTTSYSIYTFQKSFERYRYYRQMAFYKRAIQLWFTSHYSSAYNFNEYTIDVLIVPVETQGFYMTGVYAVDEFWLAKGRQEAKGIMGRYAWHVRFNEYRFSPEECAPEDQYKYLRFSNPETK